MKQRVVSIEQWDNSMSHLPARSSRIPTLSTSFFTLHWVSPFYHFRGGLLTPIFLWIRKKKYKARSCNSLFSCKQHFLPVLRVSITSISSIDTHIFMNSKKKKIQSQILKSTLQLQTAYSARIVCFYYIYLFLFPYSSSSNIYMQFSLVLWSIKSLYLMDPRQSLLSIM